MTQLAIAPSRRAETYRFRDEKLKVIAMSSQPASDEEAYRFAEQVEATYVERCADVWPNQFSYTTFVMLPYALDVQAWEWYEVA